MRKYIKLLLLTGLMLMTAAAFAACDSDTNEKSTVDTTEAQTTEATEATEATEQTTTAGESGDYDIMEGSRLVENGSELLLYGNDFMIIMPNDDDWKYEKTSDTSMSIYLEDAREDGYDGNLVTIMAFDPEDTSYEQFPDYAVAGHGKNVNKTFIALFPTDVQFNPQDPDQAEDYQELFSHVQKIAEGMANSPFQVADSD